MSTLSSCIIKLFLSFMFKFIPCSARHAYENCVYKAAKLKCKATSAIFTKKIVEVLSSEKQFNNCRKIQDYICSKGSQIRLASVNLFINLTIFSLCLQVLFKSWWWTWNFEGFSWIEKKIVIILYIDIIISWFYNGIFNWKILESRRIWNDLPTILFCFYLKGFSMDCVS